MRKLLSILTVTGLLLVMSAWQAKADCSTVSNLTIPIQGNPTLNGQFCHSSTDDFLSFTGTAAYNGQTYNLVAVANVTQGNKQVTVSGSITISGNGVNKEITFNKTVSTAQYGNYTGFITLGEKLASQL
jgi:hypothetical protein